MVFVVFGKSVRLSRLLPQLRRVAGHSTVTVAKRIVTGRAAGLFNSQIREGRLFFSPIKKLLGRTETRTRDRMYLGRIQSVRDISRDNRARIATCRLRTPTDRQTDRPVYPILLSSQDSVDADVDNP